VNPNPDANPNLDSRSPDPVANLDLFASPDPVTNWDLVANPNLGANPNPETKSRY
jgi:hypothetical protein